MKTANVALQHRISRLGLALALGLTLSCAGIAPAAAQAAPRQLVTGAAQGNAHADPLPNPDPLVLRQRGVQLNLGSLTQAMVDAGHLVQVAFFDDATFAIEITASHATYSGGSVFVGQVAGTPMSPVVMVDNGGVVSIMVVANGRRYELQGTPGKGYVARELADHGRRDHPDIDPAALTPPVAEANSADNPVFAPPTALRDDGSTIDVMVMYTPAARTANGGTAQMQANIDAQVALTNLVYANSNVVQRLRLVYRDEIAYAENTIDNDLYRITTINDGVMDQIPILRNLYGADIVSLWGVYSGICGVGYALTPENPTQERYAYNVVASPACTGAGSYSYAHELGHNMGLLHDPYMTPGNTAVTPEAGGPITTITYAHGYVDLANRFATVMAYTDQCVANGFPCSRIPYFSNPAISFNNSGFYASAVLAPTGNNTTSNERQALNDTRETTANFRQGLLNFTGPGVAAFMRSFHTVAEAGGSITLTVGRHVGSTGAISVAYSTANGSAVAGQDFIAASGTLSWADGDISEKPITINIASDALLEGPETFSVILSAPTGGASVGLVGGTTSSATVTITDDDPDVFPLGTAIPAGYATPAASSGAWGVDLTTGFLSTASLRSANVLGPSSSQTVYANSDLEYAGVFAAGKVLFVYKLSSSLNLGQFDFMIDNVVVLNSVGGEVPWTTASVPITAGPHQLRWRFKNRLNFPCANSVSGSQCQDRLWVDNIVLPLAPIASTVTLASSANPAGVGQAVTFTATVAGTSGIPVGLVDFRDGVASIPGCAGVTMISGSAQCTTSALTQGAHNITAIYSGSVNHGSGASSVLVQQVSAGDAKAAKRSDIDGDGKGEILWHNGATGKFYALQMNGFTASASAVIATRPDLNWQVAAIADIDGDGKADIVWHNASTGAVEGSLLNGAAVRTTGTLHIEPDTRWNIAGAGDFNGDGKADLLWRHSATGDVYVMLLNGLTPAGGAVIYSEPDAHWQIQQVADFDGNGKADILWRNSATGDVYLMLMNGTSVAGGGVIATTDTQWQIQEAADFDGDGKADILWRNRATGDVYMMLMNGTAMAGGAVFYSEADANWKIVNASDYNGDGKADILWRNAATGQVYLMTMNGTAVTRAGFVFTETDASWRILP